MLNAVVNAEGCAYILYINKQTNMWKKLGKQLEDK